MLGLEVPTHDNKSTVDIRNVGNDEVKTSFIGKFEISLLLVKDFQAVWTIQPMLSKTAKMQTQTYPDIHTKEIECPMVAL